MIPEPIRENLFARGVTEIDVGNIIIDLEAGKITRTITFNGYIQKEVEFETAEIDWNRVKEAWG